MDLIFSYRATWDLFFSDLWVQSYIQINVIFLLTCFDIKWKSLWNIILTLKYGALHLGKYLTEGG